MSAQPQISAHPPPPHYTPLPSITMLDIEEAAPENSLIDLSGLEFEIK